MKRNKLLGTVTKFGVLAFVLLMLGAAAGYCQDVEKAASAISQLYGNETGGTPGKGLFAGFSLASLVGGIIFGSIGFIAFIYGKKNSEFRPMIVGVFLMGYPYFFKGTVAMYLIGIIATVVLFVWRE